MQFTLFSLKVRVLTILTITLGISFGFVLLHLATYSFSMAEADVQARYRSFVIGLGGLSLLVVIPALISILNRMIFARLSALLRAVESSGSIAERQQRLRLVAEQQDEIGRLSGHILELLTEPGREERAHYDKLHFALAHMPLGICIFDHDHRLVLCSHGFEEVHGLVPGKLSPGTPFWQVQDLFLQAGCYTKDEIARIEGDIALLLRCSKPMYTVETPQLGRSVSVARVPLPGGGWLATYEDITERKEAESRLAFLAHHDALTGLSNRVALYEEMATSLARVSRQRMLAVLYLDLDRFKAVNDTLGHAVGDELLKAVSDRLRSCVRTVDLVSRIGGDEFVVLMRSFTQLEEAGILAARIIEALGRPFDIADHRVLTGASVGISVAPFSGLNPQELLEAADGALYRSKSEGRGRFQYATLTADRVREASQTNLV